MISERLGYRGPAYYVVEYRRFKYVCRGCAAAPITAALPPEILPKASADPSRLAHLIVSKFVDHIPLHRHESILARHGLTVHRSTLGDWLAGCAQALLPLYQVMATLVRQSKIVYTDDTLVTQLDRDHAAGRVTGRVWVDLGDQDHPYTVFDATSSRSWDGPVNFLKDFHGYLQADAFGGYDGLYAKGVTEVACWAHARRKFVDAKESAPAEAHQALARIGRLYGIERRAKDLNAADRMALRQAEATPVVTAMGQWLEELRPQTLPKSVLGQALTYLSNQWGALQVYLNDGELAIDNNRAERALRRIAIGRKKMELLRQRRRRTKGRRVGQLHCQPYGMVDHYRVLDDRIGISDHSGHDPVDLNDALARIRDVLQSRKYAFVNLSIGPCLPIEDHDVHVWTTVLDSLLSDGETLTTVAVGNDGEKDHEFGNARVQVPSDSVNSLAVGAASSQGKTWTRSPYSCIGPGRRHGLIKPEVVAFGGSAEEPFFVLDPSLSIATPDAGTSFAAPYALRMGMGIRAHFGTSLSALAIKALLVHCSEQGKNLGLHEVGWGRVPRELDALVVCKDGEARIVYQGELTPGQYLRTPVPLPDGVLEGMVTMTATFCFACETDAHDPATTHEAV